MKIRHLAPWLLLAAGLLALLAVGTVQGGRKAEIARAAAALQDLHRFLFDRSIVHEIPFPATLEEVPEWKQHVDGLADRKLQALCRNIVYACEPGEVPEGTPLAAIELDRMRVVLLRGGAVFAEPIRSRVERPLAPRNPAGALP